MLPAELSEALSIHWGMLQSLSDEMLLRDRQSWSENGEVTQYGGAVLQHVWRMWKVVMSVVDQSELMLPLSGCNGLRESERAVRLAVEGPRQRVLSRERVGKVVDLQLRVVRELGTPCKEALAEYKQLAQPLPRPRRLECISHAPNCMVVAYAFRVEWISLQWFVRRLGPRNLPVHVMGRIPIDTAPFCRLFDEVIKVPKPRNASMPIGSVLR